MIDEIVVIYAITDDLLKAIVHQEDCRRTMSDAEVYTHLFKNPKAFKRLLC